jgi:hypothetical protein
MLTANLIAQLAGLALSDLPKSVAPKAAGGIVQHILALSGSAVIVRHWFEIDLDDSSMEHGVRVELRKLADHPRRGSESAAQLVTVDRPLWRADLFDRHPDAPGSFGVAHYHPRFLGNEPCPRVWDSQLTADPWRWLKDQFTQTGTGQGSEPWPLDDADSVEVRQLAGVIVALARQLAPDHCTSATQCFGLTRDVRDAVQLMIAKLKRPDLLDTEWVSPWTGPE